MNPNILTKIDQLKYATWAQTGIDLGKRTQGWSQDTVTES